MWEYKVSNRDMVKFFCVCLDNNPERFEKIHSYHMYNWKTSGLHKYIVFIDLLCAIASNFTIFLPAGRHL